MMHVVPADKKNEVKLFRLRDLMLELAQERGISATEETILDLPEETRRVLRGWSVEKILVEAQSAKVCIVSTPASFIWKKRPIRGLEFADVQKLNPELFLTIIDDVFRVRRTLRNERQWQGQEFTLEDIAEWRQREIEAVQDFVRIYFPQTRRHYLFARDHPPDVLYDLIFSTHKKKVYFSYGITHADEKALERVKALISKLRDHYVVFDPLTIKDHLLVEGLKELSGDRRIRITISYRTGKETFDEPADEVEEASKVMDTQIVTRDYQMVDNSDIVVAYLPGVELATGVICEIVRGYTYGKPVYTYHPHEASPFLAYHCTKLFTDENEFVQFLLRAA